MQKAKEDAEHLLQESNAKIENTIRTIKEAQAEKGRTRTARQELADFKQEVETIDTAALEEQIARKMERLREKQKRKEPPCSRKQSPSARETMCASKVRQV